MIKLGFERNNLRYGGLHVQLVSFFDDDEGDDGYNENPEEDEKFFEGLRHYVEKIHNPITIHKKTIEER